MYKFINTILFMVLITYACYHVSQPSDTHVWVGVAEIVLAVSLLWQTYKEEFKSY